MWGKKISLLIASLLVIISLSGCLGSDSGEETQRIASDMILTIDEFPSSWREGTPDYFTVNKTDNYAIKMFEVESETPSSVEIAVMVYDPEDQAKEIYSNTSEAFAHLGPIDLDIGDEGFILYADSLLWDSMMITFRSGDTVVGSIAYSTTALPISESWFIDLMELQESRL